MTDGWHYLNFVLVNDQNQENKNNYYKTNNQLIVGLILENKIKIGLKMHV